MKKNIVCPCCWFDTVKDFYEICEICGWENDPIQRDNPMSDVWANTISLFQSQQNVLKEIPSSVLTFKTFTRKKNRTPLKKCDKEENTIRNGLDYFNKF